MKSQRQRIYEVLCESEQHPTANEIFMEIRKEHQSIALGTVYRNLHLMCRAGEIMRIAVDGEPDHYDGNPAYHNHIICKQCGKVRDVTLADLCPMFSEAAGNRILKYDLLLYEICADCSTAAT